MRLIDALYFMPAIVCMLWAMTFLLTDKTHRQKVMLACLVIAIPSLISKAIWALPDTDYLLFVQLEWFCLPLAMMQIAMMAIYMNVHATGSNMHLSHALLLAPGMMYGSALDTLYYIMGPDNAASYYTFVDNNKPLPAEYTTKLYETFGFITGDLKIYFATVFVCIILCECIYVIYKGGYRPGDLFRFIIKKQKSTPSRMIALCMLLVLLITTPQALFSSWVPENTTLGVSLAMALSIVIHLMCYTEHHSNMVTISSSTIIASIKADKITSAEVLDDASSQATEKKEETSKDEASSATEDTAGNEDFNITENDLNIDSIRVKRATSIFNGFTRLMIEDKIYLDADLTVSDVAERLLIGRSTLSNMINHEYGKTFRSVLNDYRIYYAKQYMLDNPGCTQETIAMNCGFKDASAFSHKFKDIVGTSPLVWLTSQLKKEKA